MAARSAWVYGCFMGSKQNRGRTGLKWRRNQGQNFPTKAQDAHTFNYTLTSTAGSHWEPSKKNNILPQMYNNDKSLLQRDLGFACLERLVFYGKHLPSGCIYKIKHIFCVFAEKSASKHIVNIETAEDQMSLVWQTTAAVLSSLGWVRVGQTLVFTGLSIRRCGLGAYSIINV